MDDEVLDPNLAEALGSAANALRDWGRQRGLRYELDRPLLHGRSGAVVALVYVTEATAGHTRKLLLKLDVFSDGPASEFQRQRAALEAAPPQFARQHLGRLAPRGDDLIPVGDGRWFVFQEIAGTGDGEDGDGRLDEQARAGRCRMLALAESATNEITIEYPVHGREAIYKWGPNGVARVDVSRMVLGRSSTLTCGRRSYGISKASQI